MAKTTDKYPGATFNGPVGRGGILENRAKLQPAELQRRLSKPSELQVLLVRHPVEEDLPIGIERRTEILLKVVLRSKMRPELTSIGYLDPDAERLEYLVSSLAGALAERQDATYGDNHCPKAIASAAARMYHKLREQSEKLAQDAGLGSLRG